MTIAAERYLAVCHPFKHNEFTERKIVLVFALIYVMSILLNSITTVEVSVSFSLGFIFAPLPNYIRLHQV